MRVSFTQILLCFESLDLWERERERDEQGYVIYKYLRDYHSNIYCLFLLSEKNHSRSTFLPHRNQNCNGITLKINRMSIIVSSCRSDLLKNMLIELSLTLLYSFLCFIFCHHHFSTITASFRFEVKAFSRIHFQFLSLLSLQTCFPLRD